MQIMVPACNPADLVGVLSGKKVLIWTCNTCARLCNVGGTEKVEELCSVFESAGISVVGTVSRKALCLISETDKKSLSGTYDFDVVLVLACRIASHIVKTITDKSVINPVNTLGEGYRSIDGTLFVDANRDGNFVAAAKK